MSVVGFDIGNESCILAVARQRGIDVVLNDESKRETPAVVCFGDKQRFIGTAGAASTMANPKNAITQIKRLLGRKFNDPELQRDLEILPFTVFPSPDGFPLVLVNYLNEQRTFTPTQILAMILSDLKRMAEKNLNAPVADCCIGVPVYFTDLQRRAVLDAAEIAGLHPLRLFHETTATALGYGIYKFDLPENAQTNVVFVDVGHASMQVCVAGFSNGELKVLAHSYDRSLGGRDFDEVLFKHFAGKFKDEYKIDVYQNARACLRLRAACEKLKKVLSANPEAPLNIECLMDEKDVRGFIKREEFEKISSPILERVKAPLEKALAEAGLTVKGINSIEVVGSGSRVPAIMGILRRFFGKEPRRTMNASECVARGCALQCAALSPTFRVRDFQVHERFPFSIAFSEQGSVVYSQNVKADIQDRTTVFPKGVPMPSTNSLTFFRSNTFSIHFMYTCTRNLHVSNISKYSIGPFQTTKVEGARFEVKVCLNIHGIISVESITMLEEEIESPLSVEELPKSSIKVDIDESVKYSDCQDGMQNVPLPEDKFVQMVASQADAKAKNPQKKLKIIDVPVTILAYGRMTPQEVCSAMEAELVMTQQDRVIEATKDMKNAVEAYVYDIRNKLDSKYRDFVSAEEKELLCKQLQEVEGWLYEDGEDVTMEAYVAKLEELKKQGGIVEECYKDWTERELAIQLLKDCIEHYYKLASCNIRRFDHISTVEKQKVIDACGKAHIWLHEKIKRQNMLPKYVAPTLRASNVRNRVDALDRFCTRILINAKLPQNEQKIPPTTERQHPLINPKLPQTEQQTPPTTERQHPLPEYTAQQPDDTAQVSQGGDVAVGPPSVACVVEPEANAALMDIENTANGATDPSSEHV